MPTRERRTQYMDMNQRRLSKKKTMEGIAKRKTAGGAEGRRSLRKKAILRVTPV